MRIPTNQGLFATNVGTSVDASSITWTLQFYYTSFCTNFTHNPSTATTFTGQARLTGTAIEVGTGGPLSTTPSTVTLGAAPPLTLSLESAIYTTIGGTTMPFFLLTFSNQLQNYAGYTPGYTTLNGSYAAQSISLIGGSTIQGFISGTIKSGSTPLGANNTTINLTRGGSCPV